MLVPGDSERRLPVCAAAVCSSQGTVNDVYLQVVVLVTAVHGVPGDDVEHGGKRKLRTLVQLELLHLPKHTNSQPYSKHNCHRMSIQLFIHVMTHLIYFYEQLYKYQIYVLKNETLRGAYHQIKSHR